MAYVAGTNIDLRWSPLEKGAIKTILRRERIVGDFSPDARFKAQLDAASKIESSIA